MKRTSATQPFLGLEKNEDYPDPRPRPEVTDRKRARKDLRAWASAWHSWIHEMVSGYARKSTDADFPGVIDSLTSWGETMENEALELLAGLPPISTKGGIIAETTKPPPPPFDKRRGE